jgi:nicotinate-nucleotide adenylyltransferase
MPQRIGILGGAFDPPHQAHVAMAEAAIAQYQLDELRIIPTGEAWHKPRHLSSAEHREAMTRLAFGQLPKVVIDCVELHRVGPSYTIDTLRTLKDR